MQSTVPNLPFILEIGAYVCMLAGVALILFRPFFPGLAVMLAGVLAYVGYKSFVAQALSGISVMGLVLVLAFTAIGLSSSWWSEKLGLRFTYVTPNVMWGAVLGSFVGMFLFNILGMLLGLIIGAMAMELRGGRPVAEACRQGMASVMSMLGPRGFQLLMALVVGGFALDALH